MQYCNFTSSNCFRVTSRSLATPVHSPGPVLLPPKALSTTQRKFKSQFVTIVVYYGICIVYTCACVIYFNKLVSNIIVRGTRCYQIYHQSLQWRRGFCRTMTSFGHIYEFRPENESIEAYLERIELYFSANDVDEEKKVSIFLSILGGKTYSVLTDLLAPVKPREKSFAALASELTKHFQPRKIVIAERFYFHRRNQAPEENVADFLAQLRKLAKYCEFGDHLNEALRDRFVCGLKSEVTQKRLLSETNLTLNRAVEIAQSIEAAEQHTQHWKSEAVIKQVSPAKPHGILQALW